MTVTSFPIVLHPRAIASSLHDVFALVRRHSTLIWEMSRRQITDRYAGQVLGPAWAIGHPIVVVGLYITVFAFVFKVKLITPGMEGLGYSGYLLAGLIPWLTCQEVLASAATAVSSQANLVKQVVFPVEVLALRSALTPFLSQTVCLSILLLQVLFAGSFARGFLLLLPLVIVLQFMFLAGISLLLSAVGVYFRDVKDVVQVFSTLGIYLLPVAYLPEMVPPLFRPLLYFNPFSYVVWTFQDVCFFGRMEHPLSWIMMVVVSFVTLATGYRVFRALKPGFGNVL